MPSASLSATGSLSALATLVALSASAACASLSSGKRVVTWCQRVMRPRGDGSVSAHRCQAARLVGSAASARDANPPTTSGPLPVSQYALASATSTFALSGSRSITRSYTGPATSCSSAKGSTARSNSAVSAVAAQTASRRVSSFAMSASDRYSFTAAATAARESCADFTIGESYPVPMHSAPTRTECA